MDTIDMNTNENKNENKNEMANANAKDLTYIPICRLCLQERDFYGNFATIYNDGLIQHKLCMAKYSKNRRELKKIIFKVRYEEYYGDKRPAGIVDREAMKIVQTKSKREIRQEKRQNKDALIKRLAYARKCKEDLRIAREKEINKIAAKYLTPKDSVISLLNSTQEREEEILKREGED